MVSLRRYPLAVSAAPRAEPAGRLGGVAAESVRREAHPHSTTRDVSSVEVIVIELSFGFTLSPVFQSGSPLIIPGSSRGETAELEVLLIEHTIAQKRCALDRIGAESEHQLRHDGCRLPLTGRNARVKVGEAGLQ
jgi:hypothetical protein